MCGENAVLSEKRVIPEHMTSATWRASREDSWIYCFAENIVGEQGTHSSQEERTTKLIFKVIQGK